MPFGVAYGSDLRLVRRLAIEAAKETRRVQSSPEPVCHVTEFGDNAINLLLRFWITDPANGVINIKGDVFLALWDRFVAHGIEVPFPQRDLRIRDLPPEVLRRADRGREALGGGLGALQAHGAQPQRVADHRDRADRLIAALAIIGFSSRPNTG